MPSRNPPKVLRAWQWLRIKQLHLPPSFGVKIPIFCNKHAADCGCVAWHEATHIPSTSEEGIGGCKHLGYFENTVKQITNSPTTLRVHTIRTHDAFHPKRKVVFQLPTIFLQRLYLIASMYGIFTYNLGKYTIHGSYGYTNFRSVASLVWPHTNRPMTTRTGPRIALPSNSPCVEQAPQPLAAEKGVSVFHRVDRVFRGDRWTFHQVDSATKSFL